MLTYRLQPRAFVLPEGKELRFPNDVTVEICFKPGAAFGNGDEGLRIVPLGSGADFVHNPNNGTFFIKANPGIAKLDSKIKTPDMAIELLGNMLTVRSRFNTLNSLNELIETIQNMLPPLLTLDFHEPITVDFIRGYVGDVPFNWFMEQSDAGFTVVTAEDLECKAAEAILNVQLFS